MRVFHRIAADSQVFRIVQRTPDPLAVTGQDRQTIGVVQRRTIVERRRRLVGTEQEHAGQRRHTQFADFVTQVNFGLDVHDGVASRHDDKAIGAGCPWGIQQRIDSQTLVSGFWTFDPELTKTRELFAGRQRGIDSQTTRGQTVNLTLTQHAEVAGTEHADDFIVLIFAVDRIQYFEAGETEVFHRVFIVLDVTKVEIVRTIFNFAHAGRRHFIDGDRRVEVHPLMVKFKLEWGFLVIPVSFIVIKLNLLVVRVFHVAESGGQVTLRRFIAFPG